MKSSDSDASEIVFSWMNCSVMPEYVHISSRYIGTNSDKIPIKPGKNPVF
nr:MAG TPA: hypothetical protein [Caudoviricetes sp.]